MEPSDQLNRAHAAVPIAFALLHVSGMARASMLRRRRQVAGLTIDEAARLADVSVSTWHNLENPEKLGFRPKTLRRALDALNVPADTLVEDGADEEGIEQALSQAPPLAGAAAAEHEPFSSIDELSAKMRRLGDDELSAVSALVDQLLRNRR